MRKREFAEYIFTRVSDPAEFVSGSVTKQTVQLAAESANIAIGRKFRSQMRLAVAVVISLTVHGTIVKSIDLFGGILQVGESSSSNHTSRLTVALSRVNGSLPTRQTLPLLQQLESKAAVTQASESHPIQAPTAMPAAAPGMIFGPWYFTAKYLHQQPSPLKPIRPVYPEDAANVTGHVLLRLFIGDNGNVDKYEMVEDLPKGIFDRSAIDAFAAARYAPGKITGYPVRSQYLVEVTYEPGVLPQLQVITPE